MTIQSSTSPGGAASAFEDAQLQLARLQAAPGVRLREVWLKIADLAAATLGVERVGVWVLEDQNRAIRCRYILQRSSHEIFQGVVLRQQDFPDYFAAMHERRTIAAHDALNFPTTQALRSAYLEPLGIVSMLDAPIYLEGRLVGIVCHEHIGAPRNWSAEECAFAGSVADNIARLYHEHELHNVESALQVHQRHLMELHRMEAVGRMAAGVAHDFRSILGAAMGFAELIRRSPDVSLHIDRYAQRILEALERGRELTREMMEFGKDSTISPRVLDACAQVESMSTMLRVLLGDAIRLHFRHPAPVSRIFMDGSQLERALMNLVLNARDAMPMGGDLTVAIEDAVVEDQDGDSATYVSLCVSDTGVGMDAETSSNAFKPFFSTKGEKGTGLGLVIVEQIVSRAGGFIRIDSEPGSGTTMRVFVPRIAAAQEEDFHGGHREHGEHGG